MTESNVPRLEVYPDADGAPGLLVIVPLSTDFEFALKARIPAEDLFWNPMPAGWWVPAHHRDAVVDVVKGFFGYAQVRDPAAREPEHHFFGRGSGEEAVA